ncbi:MAG: tail fiber protein [Gammaproteobacteria bacterium]|jgi:microcystin-dependent protein|nr:tail fiber protein [Gammaproteobacteria bacterium]MBU1505339.1 tail fiber protein [Gammaproteobacteria bacterium]MBU2123289.1 tail fiber protein [Gammaproteobacteria bacterium]MBU2170571.1 tail fiber protein [Gammaproteobacteria bacterium]MBU2199805.1 tail fiber protein [Gammaproteobacteria bacterium]
MADPFVAEIRIVPFNFPPRGWAWCDGQLLPLSQNTALFSLLGTTYGGNGSSNFALPDLQGRAPMMPGQGPGLSLYDLGQSGGAETVSLQASEIPSHTHMLRGGDVAGPAVADPSGASLGPSPARAYANAAPSEPMGVDAVSVTGNGQPHNNMPPYLTAYFIIALQGVFPPRS